MWLESEAITYTGKTASTFTGLTRGALGTTAATHSSALVHGSNLEINASDKAVFTVMHDGALQGPGATASNISSVALGLNASSSGIGSSVLGYASTASGAGSTIAGYSNNVTGTNASAFGYGNFTSGNSATAVGNSNLVAGVGANALGIGVSAPGFQETVVGSYNQTASETAGSWVATDPVFQVGNGQASGSRSTAMTVLKNGRVGIGSAAPSEMLQVIGNIRAEGQISSKSQTITGGTANIDFNAGASVLTDYNCAGNLNFANLRDGGTYTLIITDAGTTQCNFATSTTGLDAATVTYRFKPTNGVRTASSYTAYTLVRVGTVVLVSWSSGF